mmetsp:Transcript_1597/g.2489  ORF Transcript_1597/g.2489 Transcript_1597/m.2489 type:complete len:340 (-) Transcript_1597:39-1058(-)
MMKGRSIGCLILFWACVSSASAKDVKGARGLSMGRKKKGGNKKNGNKMNGKKGVAVDEALGLVRVESKFSFETTYTNLYFALDGNPKISVVAEIDHSAAAASVGLTLAPNRLIVFGNPALGTPVMEDNLLAGLDLPQKMLVWEGEEGKVFVGFNPPDYLVARHDLGDVATLDTIDGALKNFASVATGVAAGEIVARPRSGIHRVKRIVGYNTFPSEFDFDTTLQNLVTAIENGPPTIAFQVDHAANAQNSGAGELLSNTLVVFGNPLIGTPLMESNPTVGIDLPLKILVTQDTNGDVYVVANTVRFLRARHNLQGVRDTLDKIDNVLMTLIGAATGKAN